MGRQKVSEDRIPDFGSRLFCRNWLGNLGAPMIRRTVLAALPDMPPQGGMKAHYPWSMACVFGAIEWGHDDDRFRPIWNGCNGAKRRVDVLNGFSFGRHLFAIPLPCPGDKP